MKAMKLSYLLAGVLALTVVVTGCQKRPVGNTPINRKDTIVRPGEIGDLPPVKTGEDSLGGNPLGTPMNPESWLTDPALHDEDRQALKAHIVHFEYDSSVIKSGEQANVEAVASYLKSNSEVGLRVDGHCDERGTEGYNDSLGERRAAALREALIGLGANPNLVITRSLGEREPVASGHDESAYAQNRRGEFIVLRKK
ncbi:MAG: OmpA family protein [Verrucomicrobiota bacterium]